MPNAKYRVIVLLRRRSDTGIDELVLLGVVVCRHCYGCVRTGEFDWLAMLGIEESFGRRRAES